MPPSRSKLRSENQLRADREPRDQAGLHQQRSSDRVKPGWLSAFHRNLARKSRASYAASERCELLVGSAGESVRFAPTLEMGPPESQQGEMNVEDKRAEGAKSVRPSLYGEGGVIALPTDEGNRGGSGTKSPPRR